MSGQATLYFSWRDDVNGLHASPDLIPRSKVAALVILLGLGACTPVPPETASKLARPAYVEAVRVGDTGRAAFIGEVRAARRAELAFAVSGRVAEVRVSVGDRVRAGQILAVLDEVPLRAQLATAAGELARIQAQHGEAERHARRLNVAQQAGAASAAEFSASQAELAASEAALQSALAQHELAVWSLANTSLRAPVDGVVAVRNLEPGQAAGPGAMSITLDGAGRELSMLLPASLKISPDQQVVLKGEAQALTSQVLRVSKRVEAGGVRRVFFSVPEEAEVGTTWAASLLNPAHQAVAKIPLRAVLPGREGEGQVLRLKEDGRTTELVHVRLGALQGELIEIKSGLSLHDRVVIAGAAGIPPGSVITPVPFRNGQEQL